jgi:hypothetical protein
MEGVDVCTKDVTGIDFRQLVLSFQCSAHVAEVRKKRAKLFISLSLLLGASVAHRLTDI